MTKLQYFIIYLAISFPLIAVVSHILLLKRNSGVPQLQRLFVFLWFVITVALFFIDKPIFIHMGNWPSPFSITLHFDRFTKLMLLVFSVVTSCINCYSEKDPLLGNPKRSFYIGYWLLLFAVTGAISTHDLFNLYVWLELALTSAFILLYSATKPSPTSILHYAILNITGTLLLLVAVAFIYGYTGSLDYQMLLRQSKREGMTCFFSLLFFAIGVKGAVFPLYFWLPKSYPETSPSSRMLISSLVTKTIMVVLIRLVYLWQPLANPYLKNAFIFTAGATMVLGVLGAACQSRLQRILSFHIISQLGYVLLAIAISDRFAVLAALFFLIHNIFIKTNLFMITGLIEQQFKTDSLPKLGNLIQNNPLLSAIFFITSMSLAGIPPLSGFWAKFVVFKACIDKQFYISLSVAIFVSLLTLYSMLKIWRYVFCEPCQEQGFSNQKIVAPKMQRFALAALTICSSMIGLYPDMLINVIREATELLKVELKNV
jgi:multicomponent Na+:H+ antiporter subunit D